MDGGVFLGALYCVSEEQLPGLEGDTHAWDHQSQEMALFPSLLLLLCFFPNWKCVLSEAPSYVNLYLQVFAPLSSSRKVVLILLKEIGFRERL